MPHPRYASDEIVRRGEEIYNAQIRDKVINDFQGKYMAIDIETEEYALGDDQLTVGDTVREKHPDAAVYVLRVGYKGVTRFGRRASAAMGQR